jgi:integrase
VFTTRERKPLNRTYFNPRIWKAALEVAGIAPTRENGMHALRHYFASVLLSHGRRGRRCDVRKRGRFN